MNPALTQSFNAHAPAYDTSLEPILAIKDALHLLIRWQLSGLPDGAHVLLVGAGTGGEARALAPRFPTWRFTLVDPAEAMLTVARRHAEAEGFAERCTFHVGTVESLAAEGFDAATSVLVSHFLTDAAERQAYYAEIGARLKPGGRFFDAALCANLTDPSFDVLMDLWVAQGMAEERKPAFRGMFGKGVAAQGPAEVEALIAGAGFLPPVQVFQATLVRAWVTTRG